MFKDTVSYTDFNGDVHTKELYFHLSATELLDMEYSKEGTWSKYLGEVLDSGDNGKMIFAMQDLIKKSYGVKSEDGQRFIKSPEILDEFLQSGAYQEFFMKLLANEDYSTNFVNGILPKDLSNLINKNSASDSRQDLIQKFKDREVNRA